MVSDQKPPLLERCLLKYYGEGDSRQIILQVKLYYVPIRSTEIDYRVFNVSKRIVKGENKGQLPGGRSTSSGCVGRGGGAGAGVVAAVVVTVLLVALLRKDGNSIK